MKICTKCNIAKPFNEFYKQASSKDGMGYYCKECEKANKKEYYLKNSDQDEGLVK